MKRQAVGRVQIGLNIVPEKKAEADALKAQLGIDNSAIYLKGLETLQAEADPDRYRCGECGRAWTGKTEGGVFP